MIKPETVNLDADILNECLLDLPEGDVRTGLDASSTMQRILHILSTTCRLPLDRACPQV
jgi:hypothetical protein